MKSKIALIGTKTFVKCYQWKWGRGAYHFWQHRRSYKGLHWEEKTVILIFIDFEKRV